MADLEDVTLDGRPLQSLRVADLKAALEERGLSKSGHKNALIKRLKGVSSVAKCRAIIAATFTLRWADALSRADSRVSLTLQPSRVVARVLEFNINVHRSHAHVSICKALCLIVRFASHLHINNREKGSSVNLLANLKVCIGVDVVLLAC